MRIYSEVVKKKREAK